jgi:hypothetical protein
MTRPPIHALRLVLNDGTERAYLIEDPAPAALPADTVYDPCVHLVYLLAQQGRDAEWLTRFTGLPPAAVREIAEAARQP